MLPTLVCLAALMVLFSYRLVVVTNSIVEVFQRGCARRNFYRLQRATTSWRGWAVELGYAVRRRPAQDAFRFYEERVRELLRPEVRYRVGSMKGAG
jgi:hypothetical protein